MPDVKDQDQGGPDDLANNKLREGFGRSGALREPLIVDDYNRGYTDFEEGRPPPDRITSTSYDLGRQRAAEKQDVQNEVRELLRKEQARSDAALKALLSPEAWAEHQARIAEIWKGKKRWP